MKRSSLLAFIFLLLYIPNSIADDMNCALNQPASSIIIDCDFSDWVCLGIDPIGIDKAGDISKEDIVDWTDLWICRENGFLFISYQTVTEIDFRENAWRYAVFMDTDIDFLTGYRGMDSNSSLHIGADYLIEGAVLHKYIGNGTSWEWKNISTLQYCYTTNRLEMAIPESCMGLKCNYSIKVMLLGNNIKIKDFFPDDRSGFIYLKDIYIDGNFDDWNGIFPIRIDPNDIDDDEADIKAGYAFNNEYYLYLRLDVFGDINPNNHYYFIYLDTDLDNSTGLTFGWWTTGADYRIYLEKWNIGLQKFMGTNQSDDTWGWDGNSNDIKNIEIIFSENKLECAVPRKEIGETNINEKMRILYRSWPGDDSIPYFNAHPITYIYGECYSQFKIPRPIMLAIDDVGWPQVGPVDHIRNTVLEDYEVIKRIGEAVGHRILPLFIMGYFDPNCIIDECGETVKPDSFTCSTQNSYKDKINYVKDNAAYIEFGMHGNLHGAFWDTNYDGKKESFCDEFYQIDKELVPYCNDNVSPGHPWPSQQVDDHIECFERLISQFDIPFPKSFVAPSHGYYWNPNDPNSTGAKLSAKGIKYVNNDFSIIDGLRTEDSWGPKDLYMQEGGELDHGLLLLRRPIVTECPCYKYECKLTTYPAWPFVFFETHWTNWLNPDPNKNMGSPGEWYIFWFKNINNRDDRYLPKNTSQCYSQWLYRKYAKVTETSPGTVEINNIWQTPDDANDEKKAYDERMKDAAYNNNLLSNLLIKRPLNGQHILSASIYGNNDDGAQIVAYYEDDYGYGYLIIGHKTEQMGKLKQDVYTLNYELGPTYMPAYVDIGKNTYNIFSFESDSNQCRINLKLEMYGTQEVRTKLPFEPNVYNITSSDPDLYVFYPDWDPNINILSMKIRGKNIQGEVGTISSSCEIVTYEFTLPKGWSMISLPVVPNNKTVSSLFPEAVVVYGYEKNAGFVWVKGDEELKVGKGYWILLNEAKNYTITGQSIQIYPYKISEDGWNMIGGCTYRAKAYIDKGDIVVIYGFDPKFGYQRLLESDSLEPGKAYWILCEVDDVIGHSNFTVSTQFVNSQPDRF
jgi:hypothetical protein